MKETENRLPATITTTTTTSSQMSQMPSYPPTAYAPPPIVVQTGPKPTPLSDSTIIVEPKRPDLAYKTFTVRSVLSTLLTCLVIMAVIFFIGVYFSVDIFRPFEAIGDFFATFNFGEFFRDLFNGSLFH